MNKLLLLFSALNYGLMAFDINLIKYINDNTYNGIDKILYIIIGLLFICWLPFLDDTIFPIKLLSPKFPIYANEKIKLKTKPNRIIVYWAANPHYKVIKGIKQAYGNYSNSGITKSDNNGWALLKFRTPGIYNKNKKKHIHYRVSKDFGILGPVKTLIVS
jgi:uncharacterized membrane protein YuzA (DUF378 family)